MGKAKPRGMGAVVHGQGTLAGGREAAQKVHRRS